MDSGAGICPNVLLAAFSFQSPVKLGLAIAGSAASVNKAKIPENRLVVMEIDSFVFGQYNASLRRTLAFVMLDKKCQFPLKTKSF
jgi:hypothetical protein